MEKSINKVGSKDLGQKNRDTAFYLAHLKVDNFPHGNCRYDSVTIALFRDEEKLRFSKADCKRLIKNYTHGSKDDKGYAEGAIEELFTREEIKEMRGYFKSFPKTKFKSEKANLPIENNMMGTGAIPVGGGTDFYAFSGHEDYPLKFKVCGYFDIRRLEPTKVGD